MKYVMISWLYIIPKLPESCPTVLGSKLLAPFWLGVELNKPTYFTVNTKAAGKAKLDAQFVGPTKAEAVHDFDIVNNHDNTYTVKYTPVQQVSHIRPDMQMLLVVLNVRLACYACM